MYKQYILIDCYSNSLKSLVKNFLNLLACHRSIVIDVTRYLSGKVCSFSRHKFLQIDKD